MRSGDLNEIPEACSSTQNSSEGQDQVQQNRFTQYPWRAVMGSTRSVYAVQDLKMQLAWFFQIPQSLCHLSGGEVIISP